VRAASWPRRLRFRGTDVVVDLGEVLEAIDFVLEAAVMDSRALATSAPIFSAAIAWALANITGRSFFLTAPRSSRRKTSPFSKTAEARAGSSVTSLAA